MIKFLSTLVAIPSFLPIIHRARVHTRNPMKNTFFETINLSFAKVEGKNFQLREFIYCPELFSCPFFPLTFSSGRMWLRRYWSEKVQKFAKTFDYSTLVNARLNFFQSTRRRWDAGQLASKTNIFEFIVEVAKERVRKRVARGGKLEWRRIEISADPISLRTEAELN